MNCGENIQDLCIIERVEVSLLYGDCAGRKCAHMEVIYLQIVECVAFCDVK